MPSLLWPSMWPIEMANAENGAKNKSKRHGWKTTINNGGHKTNGNKIKAKIKSKIETETETVTETKTETLCWARHKQLTVGGDKLMVDPRRSCGPMLEWRRVGSPLPGVPPGEEAHDGAIRILGVISVLSDSRRLGKTLPTRRKLLSGDDGEQPNHQPPNMPEPGKRIRCTEKKRMKWINIL